MEKKPEYPITFSKCPVCGSTERIAAQAFEAEGIGESPNAKALLQVPTPVVDPRRAISQITAKMLITRVDACAVCGCLYVVEVQKVSAMVQVSQVPPPASITGGGGRFP